MTALPQNVVTDLRRRIADLEQRLQSGLAERDEATVRQATTALENARLLAELRTAGDRQTGSAEILRAIASTSGKADRCLHRLRRPARSVPRRGTRASAKFCGPSRHRHRERAAVQ